MIDIKREENILFTTATGKLEDRDYNQLEPVLNQMKSDYEHISWYFRMDDFDGWSPKGLWRDLKIDANNFDNLDKVAIVGEDTWQKLMTEAMKPLTSGEVKYFNEKDDSIARDWVRN
ncbi:STAS/SEC14 domain-containing protein [Roseivirga sp. BDSF3-8]|uniref:STAS/SEC14 domain-containing protein n=1 Tax=Roseivirga sp. BDSF3-8 TaxID=3241598 RepID=UPI003532205A